jgi:hypothetical protein
MLPSFDSLREQLLRAGIAPRRVRRYVVELREHLTDLTEQERAAGLGDRQAHDRAMVLLGGDTELAQAMIRSAPILSLATRAPWMVFVMWPVSLMVAAVFLNAVLLMHLLSPVQTLTPGEMPERYLALIDLANVVVNYVVAGALSAACITVGLRQRLLTGWIWAGLGLIAVFSGFFGFYMHVIPPEGGTRGGVVYSVVHYVYLHGRPDTAATVAVAAGRAFVLFAVAGTVYHSLRKRLTPVCA